jgi:ring-1,2-phenylacetyl-CoA epoxidase subunit PaaE
MSKFHTLVVDDIREETADCVSVSLKIPEEKKQIFKFIHGQHVTLKKLLNGTDVR